MESGALVHTLPYPQPLRGQGSGFRVQGSGCRVPQNLKPEAGGGKMHPPPETLSEGGGVESAALVPETTLPTSLHSNQTRTKPHTRKFKAQTRSPKPENCNPKL